MCCADSSTLSVAEHTHCLMHEPTQRPFSAIDVPAVVHLIAMPSKVGFCLAGTCFRDDFTLVRS